jgi:hypothetical protein
VNRRATIQLALLCVSLFVVATGASAAAGTQGADTFQKVNATLATGAYEDAIDLCELLSDQGTVNPSLSFDRAVAYLLRAASPHKNPGDLGQAAAALEETLLLDDGDTEAQSLLERLRYEISRQRARGGLDPVVGRPTLGRMVVASLHENTWASMALGGSLLLTIGLALRLWLKRPVTEIAGPTIAAIGGGVLLIGACLCYNARAHRLHTQPAVVIAEDARLLNDQGLPMVATGSLTNEVPEGARVDVLGNRGRLAHVAWGGAEGWIFSSQLRLLRQP